MEVLIFTDRLTSKEVVREDAMLLRVARPSVEDLVELGVLSLEVLDS